MIDRLTIADISETKYNPLNRSSSKLMAYGVWGYSGQPNLSLSITVNALKLLVQSQESMQSSGRDLFGQSSKAVSSLYSDKELRSCTH